jgi:hypothetical protein
MSGNGGGRGPSGHKDDGPKRGKPSDDWSDAGSSWRGKDGPSWSGKGAPWGGGKDAPWSGGKGGPSWRGTYRGAEGYGETVHVVIDRRTAENVYYALAIALGGVDWSEGDGWGRKSHHKGRGKTPPDGGWSTEPWAADPWQGGGSKGRGPKTPKRGGPIVGPVTSPTPSRNPKVGTVTTPSPPARNPKAAVAVAVKVPATVSIGRSPTEVRPRIAPVAVKPTAVKIVKPKGPGSKAQAAKKVQPAKAGSKGKPSKGGSKGGSKRRR